MGINLHFVVIVAARPFAGTLLAAGISFSACVEKCLCTLHLRTVGTGHVDSRLLARALVELGIKFNGLALCDLTER